MKIKKLEYCDQEDEWKLEPVEFLPNLNLLVGITGAGKTSILEAIATGKSLNGVKWDVLFVTDEYTEYRWSGEFETQESQLFISVEEDEKEFKEKNRFKIVTEYIYVDDKKILDRSEDIILFNGERTPKLSSVTSIVELLSQEEVILPIRDAFKKIILSKTENYDNNFISPFLRLTEYENLSLEKLK